jgi:uncharacterized protein with ParB-like and HNH nuclease domain
MHTPLTGIPALSLIRRIERGTIKAAELQRSEDLWNAEKMSRLIESLMLKIPLPMFYAAEAPNDHLLIVDGLQRISTFKKFILGNMKLSGLEFLVKYDGCTYKNLSEKDNGKMQIRIDETELQFAVIEAGSPQTLWRNVFRRLNTGGLPLTEQEIRNALYFGPATELLKKLAHSKEFTAATDNSIKDSRMAAQELILRYLANAAGVLKNMRLPNA